MNEQAIAIFCICDEVVKSFGFVENPHYKMTTAEVMAFAIISALHYQADYRTTRLVVRLLQYFPKILSQQSPSKTHPCNSRTNMVDDFLCIANVS